MNASLKLLLLFIFLIVIAFEKIKKIPKKKKASSVEFV